MKLRTFFRTHPVFTVDDFAGFLSSDETHNVRTQESLLAYHVKAGNIVRVRRGLYAVVPPGASAETYPVDPFLLASRMTKDAVLAYHTALELHGKAYSVYEHFMYLAASPSHPVTFRSLQFKGVGFPKALSLKDRGPFCRGAGPRGIHPLREEPGGIRPDPFRLPGDPPQARRHGDAGGGRPGVQLPGRLPDGGGDGRRKGGVDGEEFRLPGMRQGGL